MKSKPLILISFIIISCNTSIEEPTIAKPVVSEVPAVNLSVGNQYKIHHFERGSTAHEDIFSDWSESNTILCDTTINSKQYFIFSTGEILRSTSTAVIQWNNISDNILFSFDVKSGDAVNYKGRVFIVDNIRDGLILGSMQKIIQISSILPDSAISIQFATKFGLFDIIQSSGIFKHTYLVGAKIDTSVYGYL